MDETDSRENGRIARLAHELRNRIAPIRNVTHLLRARDTPAAGLGPLIELIERQVEGMARAIDAAEEGTRRSAAARTPAPARGVRTVRRVLIADDSEAMRDSLADVLRDQGHAVEVAADGAQALAMALDLQPEVVILDIFMPRMDGFEVARRLRARFTSTQMKLVMMSGGALDETAQRGALLAGFDRCIDKVVDLARLDALLQEP